MPRTAIIEHVITQLVEETRAAIVAVNDADALAIAYDKKLGEQREIAKARRIELGMLLKKARERLPDRSNNGNGWTAFLEAVEMSQSTAYKYLSEAGWVSGRSLSPQHGDKPGAGDLFDAPPPSDEDAPRELAVEADVPQDEDEIDRDTWCTPKWITDAIGEWDLDPCANERSHVQATKSFLLDERGEDGIVLAPTVKKSTRVFLNPPYSHVMPWVEAYAHTRFCFLLKVDPSTKWFEALLTKTEIVLFPRRTRVRFEPPEGIAPKKALAVQFPHALFYARDEDVSDAIRDLCFPPWRIR